MKRDFSIAHEFVEFIPDTLAKNTVYVSIPYATAAHDCFCGCGSRIVTPIAPTGWQLTFDGDAISLNPSVGSWQLPCRSHYWIKRDRVVWAGDMTGEQIDLGRARDRSARDHYYQAEAKPVPTAAKPATPVKKKGWIDWLLGR